MTNATSGSASQTADTGGEVVGSSFANPPADGLSLVGLANMLLMRRRIVVGFPVFMAAAGVVIALIIPKTYTATTAFVPEQSSDNRFPAALSGLANQFGLEIGAGANESPLFYSSVAKSRDLMEEVLLTRYADPRSSALPGDSATLLELLRVRGEDHANRVFNGLKKLDRLVTVPVDEETKIVHIGVRLPYPTLAAAVANKFFASINDFNTNSRQLQARQARAFVERGLSDAEHALRQAEQTHRSFLTRNLLWQQSPELTSEESRLQRDLYFRQELYLTLQREYETARIDEINDTPVLTLIDRAIPPARKSRPRRRLIVVTAFLMGLLAAITWAFAAEYGESLRANPNPDYDRFVILARQTREGTRSGVRRILRLGRR